MVKTYQTLDNKPSPLIRTHSHVPLHNSKFYPKTINKTDIKFTNKELTLLNKGLKYNLKHKIKHWFSNLALEAESAISRLPTHGQERIRHQVAHNLQKLYNQRNKQHSTCNKNSHHEFKVLKTNQIQTSRV